VRRSGAAWLVAIAGASLLSVGSANASSEPSCRTMAPRSHTEAVFGHFATLAAAKRYEASAAAAVFQGLKIENNGCGDFEVSIGGADRTADRSSFSAEARKAGFHITFQQTAPPMAFHQGQVVGVIASTRTVKQANALMWQLSDVGFQYIDLARSATRWLVVMPQVPIKHALSIAHEMATAGFQIQFRAGVK
jgi:hypothetical protein